MARLLIRADADSHIGAGHIMRMVALGQAWNELGGACLFVTARCPGGLIQRITAEGIEHRSIDVADIGTAEDRKATEANERMFRADWVALDGYQFREDYCEALFSPGGARRPKLLTMDDFGHCDTWFADAIVNQNYGAPAWGKRGNLADPTRSEWLLGPQYVLLRGEFRASTAAAIPKPRPWKKVLITLGGADDRDATGRVIEALESADHPPLSLRVLVSPTFPYRSRLDGLCRASRHEIEVLSLVRDMPAMFLWADGVVSAGGSTCWEWLSHGLSGAILTVADNQVQIADSLAEAQLAVHLGPVDEFDQARWSRTLGSWLRGDTPEADFAKRRTVVDGEGAPRLIRRMLAT